MTSDDEFYPVFIYMNDKDEVAVINLDGVVAESFLPTMVDMFPNNIHFLCEGDANDFFQETDERPPVTKYKYELTIYGNSHEEIERELITQTRGGYLMDSDYEKRDEFHVTGGRHTSKLTHTNPEMTPKAYPGLLDEWFKRRK